ncbi:TraR/DksA C4-type zinc finger protein [Ferroacidibacillus organovorans]|uniref:Zinc finger DksA/TraR C4-type domain-containing protein n=1 Tax=Ferroacidibacillus organovorans TaxID=1765683 RepID=A0A101XQA2_9BACL|nr:TraR/DksA C4-type zinc finger protein [Ferroacidibacillus organovorans]KUO95575.1 hypothetical protein ATW55_06760 [Ferroacidibacillus organovorans]
MAYDAQRRQLIEERNQIQRIMTETRHFGLETGMMDMTGELSSYDQHPADQATELFEREKDLGLSQHEMNRLFQVERALSHFADGTYGICERCKQPIEAARLEAEPAALCCIDCQRDIDGPLREVLARRPVEEEVLEVPFARTDMDDADATFFDGEDTWQALASMNNVVDRGASEDQHLHRENNGYVDALDQVSNAQYKAQLPD